MEVVKVGESLTQGISVATCDFVGIGFDRDSCFAKLNLEFLECRRMGKYLQVLFGTWDASVCVTQDAEDRGEGYFPP